ncbi:uncharacterized protein ColSpa_11332 [Colletotrichum spaethianum]|uniref:BZIP domain-containing protein n=1 Tax=Colletotrichum spaethianum TaxID=700344 RepID=A0AA37UL55_9PEZI|nr:uncharacterized protein ColSpa_11332 [Colletotrichum spaethianum]GKT51151.1 hypothetical protein ColSpa_11332 [Colletotrichum spaethianum]
MVEPATLPPLSSLMQPAIHGVMSSEDNWKGKTSPAERRKIQNRLNQRTWRQRRKQEKLQERQGGAQDASVPSSSSSPPPAGALVATSRWTTLSAASAAPDGAKTLVYATMPLSRPELHRKKEDARSCGGKVTLMALTYLGRERPMTDLQDEDMDDLYHLFLQRAYESRSRRTPSPDPMSDSLLPLVQFNLFRGLMENMKTLGITLEMVCDDECVSPFGSDPIYNVQTEWTLPFFLKPTEMQLTSEHHPWLDLLPLPRMRDNLIKAGQDWNDEELCLDMIGNGDAPSGQGGMILWGEPWDPNNWEVTEDFVEKWRWILQGCEEMIRSSNYWRAKRGERRMRVRL